MHFLLSYDYVPDVLARREPFRAEHLGRLRELHAAGTVLLAGATGDPVTGAAIVFRTADREAVEAFVRTDPYVQNGLVAAWRVEPWNVVIGG